MCRLSSLSHAGVDFLEGYKDHLASHQVDCRGFVSVDRRAPLSARCTILSDDHGNQITGFFAGNAGTASRESRWTTVCAKTGTNFALLGPEPPELMMRQASELYGLKISQLRSRPVDLGIY